MFSGVELQFAHLGLGVASPTLLRKDRLDACSEEFSGVSFQLIGIGGRA
jgi:hypothetical protein